MANKIPPSGGQPRPRSHRKQGADWKFYAAVGLLFVVLVAVFVGVYFLLTEDFTNRDKREADRADGRLKTGEMLVAKNKAMIMIMGVDSRTDDVGRSDTLMVAAIDPRKKQASLLSIPRDTRVYIGPRTGYDKINAAYPYGGRELTERVVEDFLGTPIDHYIMFNTRAFKRVIDALGGIDIDVDKRMYYEDPWDDDGGLLIDLQPGMQHLNGEKAIGYVRYRDEEGDIGRIARQQKFMRAVMDKVASPKIIADIPAIAAIVYDSIETDLTIRQIVELAGAVKEAQANGLKSEMVPGEPYDDPNSGVNYWIPSISQTRYLVADVLGVELTAAARRAMENDAAEYSASLPQNVRSRVTVDDDDEKAAKDSKDGKDAKKKDGAKKDDKKDGKSDANKIARENERIKEDLNRLGQSSQGTTRFERYGKSPDDKKAAQSPPTDGKKTSVAGKNTVGNSPTANSEKKNAAAPGKSSPAPAAKPAQAKSTANNSSHKQSAANNAAKPAAPPPAPSQTPAGGKTR